ncbi:MAG: carboxypeptidase regulatory-like domain-containing protein [Flammeovirgaceae bacterium]|nr:carboxypeptidase regulatory-like domain-containing protein [Flammeovirgaceae bacterium]
MKINKFPVLASKVIIIALLLFCFSGCKKSRLKSGSDSQVATEQGQGISGKVLWFEGNLMPGPDKKIPGGKPIEKEILIYELTNRNQTDFDGQFFSNIKTQLISQIKSDEKGQFKISLPIGNFSLFVKEKEGLFANSFDGNGNINPIGVKEGEFTLLTIKIDYKAAY